MEEMDKVIIFGMGKFFENFAEKLFQQYEVAAILDNRLDAGKRADLRLLTGRFGSHGLNPPICGFTELFIT